MHDEDEFEAELERRLLPLRDEADALLDEVLAEVEDEGVVVLLPSARPAAAKVERASRGWIGMSVAAGLLLAISALVLFGASRQRIDPSMLRVAGEGEARARVRIGVSWLVGDTPASKRDALVELRALHRPLATCAAARESSEPVLVEVDVLLRAGQFAMPDGEQIHRGELDDATRTCIAEALSEWQPASLGTGELSMVLEIEAGNQEDAR